MAAAAEALRISPSAVSQQIALLEAEAGTRLIERRGRGVVLTQAGRRLAQRTERVLQELEAARLDLEEIKSVISGELRVAAFPSVAASLVPNVALALLASQPRLAFQFDEMEPHESVVALRSWQTDIALIDDLNVPQGQLDPQIRTLPLLSDVFNIVVPMSHRLVGQRAVELSQLREERWAIDTASEAYNRMLSEACSMAGFTPNIVARSRGFEVTIAMIREGYAISMIPGLRTSRDLEDVWVCRLVPEIRRQISIAFRHDEERAPAIKAFIEEVKLLVERQRLNCGNRV